jgi:hypothetical protein
MMRTTTWVRDGRGTGEAPSEETAGEKTGSHLDQVLRILAGGGKVSAKVRHAAQAALSNVPADEPIVAAYRCGITTGTTENEGVAVATPKRVSVFDRRGFRSIDQQFHLALTTPFSVAAGPSATIVSITAAGARPVSINLLDVASADAFRDHLKAQRSAQEQGWWSQAPVTWPGWLGSTPSWSYLGGDPGLPGHAEELQMEVSPAGITLADLEGSTAHLTAWSRVTFLHVLGAEQGLQRAAATGLLSSEAFGAAWRSSEWSAFLVVGYSTGEHVYLGTTTLTEARLRALLFPVAAAMPSGERAGGPVPTPASDQAPVEVEVEVTAAPAEATADVPAVDDGKALHSAPRSHDASPVDLVTQLERIAALHRQGVLDEGEFAQAKAALLRG